MGAATTTLIIITSTTVEVKEIKKKVDAKLYLNNNKKLFSAVLKN